MRDSNAIVTVFEAPAEVAASLASLQQSHFDLRNVSVMGPGCNSSGEPEAYYQTPGRIECWGKRGMFWTGIWGLLLGWAFVSLPDFGPILVAGPLAMWIITALDNSALFAELSPVGAGLYNIGIPRARIMRYEAALKRHMYLVVVHGAATEVARASTILRNHGRSHTGSATPA